jgi:hypothetical protein
MVRDGEDSCGIGALGQFHTGQAFSSDLFRGAKEGLFIVGVGVGSIIDHPLIRKLRYAIKQINSF